MVDASQEIEFNKGRESSTEELRVDDKLNQENII